MAMLQANRPYPSSPSPYASAPSAPRVFIPVTGNQRVVSWTGPQANTVTSPVAPVPVKSPKSPGSSPVGSSPPARYIVAKVASPHVVTNAIPSPQPLLPGQSPQGRFSPVSQGSQRTYARPSTASPVAPRALWTQPQTVLIYTRNTRYQVAPYNHSLKIAKYHMATEEVVKEAIDSAMAARKEWERTPHDHRAAIFQKVADLITGKYRIQSLAATMVGQAKTAFEADIDCIQEIADFYRFGIHYAKELYEGPELHQPRGVINRVTYRGLEGFIAAISPFNFTAIGGNLAGTPAIVGNVVLWKPASTAILACYSVYKIFQEAGVPDGVVNFIPSSGQTFGDSITRSPHLAGINFTGSVETFRYIWKKVAENIDVYRTYPRLVGECGGKNFHFIHASADVETVVNCTIRASYGYGGQKCSACSRMYVPESKWGEIKEHLVKKHKELKLGSPEDYDTFVSAVIDDKSFKNIKDYIDYAKDSQDLSIVAGGKCDDSVGYFIEPTIIESKRPDDKLMNEEIFGPVLSVYVYPDQKYKETLKLVDKTSPFALTGAVFGKDRHFIQEASDILKDATGNFYINDKSTGSVVGQQPFGGARLSGTNDKAGSSHYIMRWVSPQSIKETMLPVDDYKYPHQS